METLEKFLSKWFATFERNELMILVNILIQQSAIIVLINIFLIYLTYLQTTII